VIASILLSLALSALTPLIPDTIEVSLKESAFPDKHQPGFSKPLIFRLENKPSFKIKKTFDISLDVALFGIIPYEPLPGIPLFLVRNKDAADNITSIYLDLNKNGDFTDDLPPASGVFTNRMGKITLYFPSTIIREESAPEGGEKVSQKTCLIRFSFTIDEGFPKSGSAFIDTWSAGKLTIIDESYILYLMDYDLDGKYTQNDRWTLINDNYEHKYLRMNEAAVLPGGKYWILTDFDEQGNRAVIKKIDRSAGMLLGSYSTGSKPKIRQRPESKIPIVWLKSIPASIVRSEKENKPIILMITSPDCPLCQTCFETTFRDAEVIELMGSFIPLQITNGVEDKLALKLSVPGFPFIAFLDSKLNEIKRRPGFRSAEDISRDMKEIISSLKK